MARTVLALQRVGQPARGYRWVAGLCLRAFPAGTERRTRHRRGPRHGFQRFAGRPQRCRQGTALVSRARGPAVVAPEVVGWNTGHDAAGRNSLGD